MTDENTVHSINKSLKNLKLETKKETIIGLLIKENFLNLLKNTSFWQTKIIICSKINFLLDSILSKNN